MKKLNQKVSFVSGWNDEETNGDVTYRWMCKTGNVLVEPGSAGKHLVMEYDYPVDACKFPVITAKGTTGTVLMQHTVLPGHGYTITPLIDVGCDDDGIIFSVDSLYTALGDYRELGLKIHSMSVEDDPVKLNNIRTVMAIREKPELTPNSPLVYMIGVTDKCNLRCVICLKHYKQAGDNNAGLTDISDIDLAKALPLGYTAQKVLLLGYGEPLLYKRLPELIDTISEHANNDIEIITNGLLLSEAWVDKIIHRNVSVVSISLDAATTVNYKNVRGINQDKVLANIKRLVERRKASSKSNLEIRLNMAVTRQTSHEMPLMIHLAAELGVDAVEFRHLHENPLHNWVVEKDNYTFDYKKELVENDPEACRSDLASMMSAAKQYGIKYILDAPFLAFIDATAQEIGDVENGEYHECPHPWRWLMLTAAGDAYTCCWAPPIAALKDYKSAADLWNGAEYQRLRRNIKNGTLDSLCKGVICPYQENSSQK